LTKNRCKTVRRIICIIEVGNWKALVMSRGISRKVVFLVLPAVALSFACSRSSLAQQINVTGTDQPSRALPDKLVQAPMKWPKDWSDCVGKLVTVDGVVVDMKIGAALFGDENTIFIDGIDSWPNGYWLGNKPGKRLRVTGTVIERHDLPVFIQKKDELPRQGIPVPEGTDLNKASQRFLIQNAKWTVIE
jgi:hypothetical protein